VRVAPVLLAALAGTQVAYGRLPGQRSPAATRGLVALMLTASAVEALEARGLRRGLAPVAAAGGLGFGAELVGVATGFPFGHYRYSARLGPRVRGVPVLAAAAWAMMARPAWVVAGRLAGRRRVVRVPLAAAALTAWDVFLDPRMVREGYWSWPGGGRYEDVPATNFLGWWVTGLGVFAVWTALEDGEGGAAAPYDVDLPAGGDGRRGAIEPDDGALFLYAWTWVGEAFANAVLWRRPRVAAAGAAAMGAFALPALWRRWRG